MLRLLLLTFMACPVACVSCVHVLLHQDEDVFVRISKRNRISAFCGWSEDSVGFRIYSNSSDFDNLAIETSPRLGNGCRYAMHFIFTDCVYCMTRKLPLLDPISK